MCCRLGSLQGCSSAVVPNGGVAKGGGAISFGGHHTAAGKGERPQACHDEAPSQTDCSVSLITPPCGTTTRKDGFLPFLLHHDFDAKCDKNKLLLTMDV